MIAVGFVLLAGTQTAMAGDTVRDHRGANGAPEGGVTVNGQKATTGTAAPWLGGNQYNRGFTGLTGATVRDNRHPPKSKNPVGAR